MRKLSVAITVLLLLGIAAPALAKPPYPRFNPTCAVSDTTLSPGDEVTVSGEKWKPGSTVRVTLRPEGILLGTATVAADKTFSIVVTIPEDIRLGPHRIVCSGSNIKGVTKVRGTNIQVLAAVAAAAGTAFTGASSNVPLWAGVALVLVLAGVTALFLARRRRGATVRRT